MTLTFFFRSGSHVNDDMNQPDSEGRVLVNVGHPPNEPDIFLAPQLAYVVKPHQVQISLAHTYRESHQHFGFFNALYKQKP